MIPLTIKLLLPIITLIIALITLGLQHKWRDRRTKNHRIVKGALVSLLIIIAILSLVLVYIDDNQLSTMLDNQTQLLTESKESKEIAIEQRDCLYKRFDSLETYIKPIQELAQKKYPDLREDEALKKLALDVESIKIKTKELDLRTKERLFTPDQVENMKSYLSGFHSRVTIKSIMGDVESISYSSKIKKIFTDSGWNVTSKRVMPQKPIYGLEIYVLGKPIPETAKIVQTAFQKINIQVEFKRNVQKDPDVVELIIGSKRH